MKKNTHPTYHDNATITCACGATFVAGSTEESIKVEICSMCHPFFTGKQKFVDTAGRVDKFRARVAAAKKVYPESSRGAEAPKAKTKPEREKTEKTTEE